MKHAKQRNIKLGVLVLISVSLLVFLFNEDLTGNQFNGTSFNLPEMRIAGGSNAHTADSNVSCDLKSTLYVLDNTGKTVKTVQSSMLDNAVPLDLVNPFDDTPISIFVVIPKIFCTTDNEDVTVTQSDLNLTVYGATESIKDSKTQKLNQHYTTSGGYENQLSYFSVSDTKIESALPSSVTFESDLRFDITGNVKMIYDNTPSDVMTIPINSNDISTTWHYKSVTDNPTSQDSDHDGIDDEFDECPNQGETHNNYQDSDGCPDTVPNTSPATSTTSVTPVTKNSCNAENKTWYITSNGNGICSTQYLKDNIYCKEYDARAGTNSCIDPNSSGVTPTSNDIPAKVKFQVDVKMNGGGTQSYMVQDDPSPFDFAIPLSLIASDTVNGQTAQFNIEPRLVISDEKVHRLTDTKGSDLNISTIVSVHGVDYPLSSEHVSQFVPRNGGAISDSSVGFPLGSVNVLSSKIESVIPMDVVPMGSEASVDVRFVVDGEIRISNNDGSTHNSIILDVSGADFEIKNLKIVRSDPFNPVPLPPITPPRPSDECKADEHTEIVGMEEICVPNDIDTPPEDLSCLNNEHIEFFNSIPECVVNTGGEIEQCPDGTSECIIIDHNTDTGSGESSGSSGGSADDNTVWYIAIGILGFGILVFAIKRRS